MPIILCELVSPVLDAVDQMEIKADTPATYDMQYIFKSRYVCS